MNDVIYKVLEIPLSNFVAQWPFVAILIFILWYMRQDLKECLNEYRDLVRSELEADHILPKHDEESQAVL